MCKHPTIFIFSLLNFSDLTKLLRQKLFTHWGSHNDEDVNIPGFSITFATEALQTVVDLLQRLLLTFSLFFSTHFARVVSPNKIAHISHVGLRVRLRFFCPATIYNCNRKSTAFGKRKLCVCTAASACAETTKLQLHMIERRWATNEARLSSDNTITKCRRHDNNYIQPQPWRCDYN